MKIWDFLKTNKFAHEAFEAGVTLKLINGVLETVGAVLLIFASPANLSRLVTYFTQEELSQDPNDLVANYFLHVAQNFSHDAQLFGIIYLLAHGLIKIFLVVNLWEKKLWAYPTAIGFFTAFTIYQIYRFLLNHSVFMFALTILDILVILLTWVEYKRIKDAPESA